MFPAASKDADTDPDYAGPSGLCDVLPAGDVMREATLISRFWLARAVIRKRMRNVCVQ